MEIKLSIIVACYNIEKYIADCLNSILPQLTEECELIVINDGSTDSSLQIIREIRKMDNRCQCFSYHNGGLSTARNRGFTHSKGQYLWFVDGDDFIADDAIKVLLSTIKYGDYDIIGFNHADYTKEGVFPHKVFENQELNVMEYLSSNVPQFAWNKIYRRHLLEKVTFVDGLRNIEDFVFNISISPYVKSIRTMDNWLYAYNQLNESSISRCRSPRHLINLSNETFRAHNILLDIIRQLRDNEMATFLMRLLTFSFVGHIFSLCRFYNYRSVNRAISIYRQWGVFPFMYVGNYRCKVFTFVINNKLLRPMFYSIIKKLSK